MTVEDFVEAVSDDVGKTLLAGSAIVAGTQSLYQAKVKALAKAVARGVLEETPVDAELIVVRTLAEMEEPHIRVLLALNQA